MRRYLVLSAEPLAVVRVVLISLCNMEHIGEDALGRFAVRRLDIVLVVILVVVDAIVVDVRTDSDAAPTLILVVVVVLLRPLDEEETRQHLDEQYPHQLGHTVGNGRAEIHVQHGYRDDHRRGHHHHRE